MGYEINISKDGKHHFATHERSIGYCVVTLRKLIQEFREMYPLHKGYKIEVNDVSVTSKKVII